MAHHLRGRAGRPRLIRPPAAQSRLVVRVALLVITVALTAGIAAATISDIVQHGLSWLDIAALLVVVLFATGICGSLWESIRRK